MIEDFVVKRYPRKGSYFYFSNMAQKEVVLANADALRRCHKLADQLS